MGEKDPPLYNGCRNCGHKHSEDLALRKGQECLCNVTRKGGRGSESVGPIKVLQEWEQNREHKKTEPPWTLLVNGARLFRFTSAFCSIAKLSHVVRTLLSTLWQSKVFVASVNLYRRAPVFHLCRLERRRRRKELSIKRVCCPRDAPTHHTRAPPPAHPSHVTITLTNVTKTHRYISLTQTRTPLLHKHPSYVLQTP